MNPDLQNKIWLALFGVSGPVAKGLTLWLGLDSQTIEILLDIAMIVTPSIAGWIMAQMSTIANKMAHIEAMTPADQARIATALPPAAVSSATAAMTPTNQARVAAALPDSAVVAAVENMPGVRLAVDTSADSVAPQAAVAAANDPSRESVVPTSATLP